MFRWKYLLAAVLVLSVELAITGPAFTRNLEKRDAPGCVTESDCSVIEHCTDEGKCSLTWWFILIIVLICLFILSSILSCICCPCCFLYNCAKDICSCLFCCCND